jgi:uncharacterized lipoprotein YehR (DUF1307 family)
MKAKKMILGIALLAMVMVSACGQKYDAEKDFKVQPSDDGKEVAITGYVGKKKEIRIPPRIQNLPVTSIGEGAFKEKKDLIDVTIPNSVTSIGRRLLPVATALPA